MICECKGLCICIEQKKKLDSIKNLWYIEYKWICVECNKEIMECVYE